MVRTKEELFQRMASLIRSGGQGGKTKATEVRQFLADLIDTIFSLFGSSASAGGILEYDPEAIYDFENNPFAVFNFRIFKTKVDGQTGNEPPFSPDAEGNYENEFWIEVSPAPASGIAKWAPGIFTGDLVIVYYNGQLYRLDVAPEAMPYESADITAEIRSEGNPGGVWVSLFETSGTNNAVNVAYYSFSTNLDTLDELMFPAKITMELPEIKSAGITSFSYEVRLDSSSTWTAKATGASVQNWINTLSEGVPYWIRVIVVPAANAGDMVLQFNYTVQ